MKKIATLFFAAFLLGSTACSEQSEPPQEKETTISKELELPTPVQKPQTNVTAEKNKSEVAILKPKPEIAKTEDKTSSKLLVAAPDFSEKPAGPPRKEAFFDYMVPLIQAANKEVLETRKAVSVLLKEPAQINSKDKTWLNSLAERYGLDDFNLDNAHQRKALLARIDEVPVSLALAQAANESAWGTSRFAKQANNYYGQWCYTKGCGLVPKQRDKGAVHEVRAFKYPYESVKSYIHNLNSHRTYEKLRNIRQAQRIQNEQLSGIKMAEGLVNYSQRKHEYVKELQSMIRYNKLSRYNLKN